jgi:SnoaL-like polyketide cyclase
MQPIQVDAVKIHRINIHIYGQFVGQILGGYAEFRHSNGSHDQVNTSDIGRSDQLRAERQAVETFYRAFTDQNPDLVDEAVTPDWKDIPPALGQRPGPQGSKPIIRSVIAAPPDVRITIQEMMQTPGKVGVRAEIAGTHRGAL